MAEQKKLAPLDENWERALAVVAHPDDLEYGAASAIARWTSQSKHVGYLLATRGEAGIDSMPPSQTGPLREQEERNSAQLVGVRTVEFLDYADGVIEYGLSLRRDIARSVRKHRPEVLITLNFELTWGGTILNMADHRWLGLAVLDALGRREKSIGCRIGQSDPRGGCNGFSGPRHSLPAGPSSVYRKPLG
jgi:LmbE family N-acetylglucosaminyl deacetylase